MNPQQLHLDYADIAIAATLILVNVGISLVLKLDLAAKWLVAGARTVAQLLLIGLILEWVFHLDNWLLVLGIVALMTVIAGRVAAQRSPLTYRGLAADGLLSVWGSTWLVTAFGLFVVLRVHPWHDPKYAIPFMGIVLGNVLTGVSLGIERITEELQSRRDRIEMLLCLGATRWEAFLVPARQAMRTGMTPTINALTVVGLVSLPGAMTGQVLAGESPAQAIRYQIVIMFLISAASGLGILAAVLLAYRRLFSAAHRFEYWRLQARRDG